MKNNFQKILILAPHTDDGELGCGGSIAKFIEEKKDIYYLAFSSAEKAVKKGYGKNVLKKEAIQAMKVLEVKHLIIKNYPVRNFPENRQAILEDLIKIREKIKPDLIFLPSLNDIHQDHQVVAQEGLRAFKKQTILL